MKDFVILNDVILDAVYEIRYYSSNNFVGRIIDGYEENCAILTKEAAYALKKVNDELLKNGYCLKIYDAYRPQRAVDDFVSWASDIKDNRMKEKFYPHIDKSELFEQGYIKENSSHSRGSTVDLTLLSLETKKEIDMGGSFDYFDKSSYFDYDNLTIVQYKNRRMLHDIMMFYGFKPIEEEWWHFTLENEPFPDTYFNFPVNSKYIK